MRYKKTLFVTGIRLGGLTLFDICLYNTDIHKLIWFMIGVFAVFYVIPACLLKIIFTETYDGTFLIDESDPTDVKFKLIFETDPEVLAKSKDFVVRVDHREANMDSDGGDLNG